MIARIGTVCIGAMLLSSCYTPAYEKARVGVWRSFPWRCEGSTDPKVWMTGDNSYVLSAPCRTKKSPAGDEWKTFLCRNGKCRPLRGLGDWTERVRATPPESEAEPDEEAAASEPSDQEGEAEIRAQIDARAAAILACANGEATVVQVEVLPDRAKISLVGKHAATPAEACVQAALADLSLPEDRHESFTVQHPVSAK